VPAEPGVRLEVAFEVLYLRLRQEGFRTGVDQQLRMQELLDRMECRPQDLKIVLCPLFATNPAQQVIFYRVFDEVFPLLAFETPAPAQEAAAQELNPAGSAAAGSGKPRRPRYSVWLIVAGIVAISLVYWLFYRPVSPAILPPPVAPAASGATGSTSPATPLVPENPPPIPVLHTVDLALPAGLPTVHPEAKRIAIEWSAILSPLLFFGLYSMYRWFLRQTSAKRGAELQPPHFWPLQLESLSSRVFRTDELRELARRMRQREDATQTTLDVPATISASIRGRGFPRFRYRPIRRPPEYLVVIERVSNADPFCSMTTELVDLLKADGVLLTRYYFEGDPRRLFTDTGDQIALVDVAVRTGDHRLLLFGSSGCLFHPVTGRLEDWVAPLFERQKLKSLLLSDAPRAKRIARLWEAGFAVATADSAGIRQTVDFFESGGVPACKAFPEFIPLDEPIQEERLEKDRLERNLPAGPEELWLASCAVYPEINWNLALRLGATIDPALLCERAAGRLARMVWLRRGEIPPHWRERLTETISESARLPIQQSLFALLRMQAVPQDTFAWENWRHTLRAFRLPGRGWRERIREFWSGGPVTLARDSAQDLTCLRFLDRQPRGRFGFTLPEWVRGLVFEQGLRVLGTRTLAWLPLAVIAMLLCAAVLRPWRIHDEDLRHVVGKVVDSQGAVYSAASINIPGGFSAGGSFDFTMPLKATQMTVITSTPIWPESVRMVGDGKVEVVVGKQNPRVGPIQVLDTQWGTSGVVVDYSGPVMFATASCLGISVPVFNVKPSDATILLPLDPQTDFDCNVSLLDSDGRTAIRQSIPDPPEANSGQPKILLFTADSGPESMGNMTVELKWQVTNADSVRLFAGKDLVKFASGATSATVNQTNPDTAYRLEATNRAGAVSQVISNVKPGSVGPVVVKLEATPSHIRKGEQARLTWQVSGLVGPQVIYLEPDNPEKGMAATGSQMVSPGVTTTYTLFVNKYSSSTTVTVDQVAIPPGPVGRGGTGSITGKVQDPSGAVIPATTVVLTSADGKVTTQTTGAEAVFTFPSLAPGNYALRAQHAGFSTWQRSLIAVGANQALNVSIQMAVGPPGSYVTFVNLTSQPVDAGLVVSGMVQSKGAIAAGAGMQQPIVTGQVWDFRQNGQVVGTYQVPNDNAPQQYIIRTDPKAPQTTPSPAQAPPGKTWGLLIGISAYQKAQPLRYANADAQAFATFLATPRGGGAPANQIMLLTDAQATSSAVRSAFNGFLRGPGRNDTVYILISGQAVVDSKGVEGYLLTAESDPANLPRTAIPMSELQTAIVGVMKSAGRVIFLADESRALQFPSPALSYLMGGINSAPGEILGMSAAFPSQVSLEGPQFGGGHGAFTWAVLQGLMGAADTNKDGFVTVAELKDFMLTDLPGLTGNKQQPVPFGSYDGTVRLSDLSKPGPP
jgi:hypothetical protein